MPRAPGQHFCAHAAALRMRSVRASLRVTSRILGAGTILALLAIPPVAAPLNAQTRSVAAPPAPSPVSSQLGVWQVGPVVAIARNSPTRSFLGSTPGRDHLFLGAQALTPILRFGPLHLSYGVQLYPLVRIGGRAAPIGYQGAVTHDGEIPGPSSAYAIGLSPFGLEVATPRRSRMSAFGGAAAGALAFTRPFPVPEANRINFTLEYGGGVRLRTRTGEWLQIGYKYHHLSNAYLARSNPGVDANVWYASYLWTARLPR